MQAERVHGRRDDVAVRRGGDRHGPVAGDPPDLRRGVADDRHGVGAVAGHHARHDRVLDRLDGPGPAAGGGPA